MLTKREKEILLLIYDGLTAKEISDTLFISEHTVKTQCKNIKRKLGARNNIGVIRKATAQGLV